MPQRLLLPFLYTLLLWSGAAYCDPSAGDRLFAAKNYSNALEEYRKELPDKKEAERWHIQARITQCHALNGNLEQAYKAITEANPPELDQWKTRFALLKAVLGHLYIKRNFSQLPSQMGSDTSDITQWNYDHWITSINSHYNELWELRDTAIKQNISDEAILVELERRQIEALPTLWDLAADQWTAFLSTPPQGRTPLLADAVALLSTNSSPSYKLGAPPAHNIAAILEFSEQTGGDSRTLVREQWALKRLLLPFEAPQLFTIWPDKASALKTVVRKLFDLSNQLKTPAVKSEATVAAAQYANELNNFSQAVALCKSVETNWPNTPAANKCAAIRSSIELPQLELSTRQRPPPGNHSIKLKTKNLPFVFFRIYRLNQSQINQLMGDQSLTSNITLQQPWVQQILKEASTHEGKFTIPEAAHYNETTAILNPPQLAAGVYCLLVSADRHFDVGHSVMRAAVLNISDSVLVTSLSQEDSALTKMRHYVINTNTGAPQSNASINTTVLTKNAKSSTNGTANKEGYWDHQVKLTQSQPINIISHAQSNEDYSLLSAPIEFEHQWPKSIRHHIDTARTVYQSGDLLTIRVLVLEYINGSYVPSKTKAPVRVAVIDNANKTLWSKALTTDSFGTATSSWNIPDTQPTGPLTIASRGNEESTIGKQTIWISDPAETPYKLTLNSNQSDWKNGNTVTLTGTALYPTGKPVQNARINFQILKQHFKPLFCWWCQNTAASDEPLELKRGSLTTNDEGAYEFTFQIPRATESQSPASSYTVVVNSRDSDGLSKDTQATFYATRSNGLIDANMSSHFTEPTEQLSVEAYLVTADSTKLTGSIEARVTALSPPETHTELDSFRDTNEGNNTDTLHQYAQMLPDGNEVWSQSVETTAEAPARFSLPNLSPGLYRLTLANPDWDDSKVTLPIVSFQKDIPVNLPFVTVSKHPTYQLGDTAEILIGSTDLKGAILVEVWNENRLASSQWLDGGIQLLKLPILADWKNTITVRWVGFYKYKSRSGSTSFQIEDPGLLYSPLLTSTSELTPETPITCTLAVSGNNSGNGKRPAIAMIRVREQSQHPLSLSKQSWGQVFTPLNVAPIPLTNSIVPTSSTALAVDQRWQEKQHGIIRSFFESRQTPPSLFVHPPESKTNTSAPSIAKTLTTNNQAPITPSHTAYFVPNLSLNDGTGTFTFTLPTAPSRWSIEAFVHTSAGANGWVGTNIATKPRTNSD